MPNKFFLGLGVATLILGIGWLIVKWAGG